MTARLITSIRISKLFGLYTYTLPESGELSNATILYGDNGVGKSTILRIVFHLLSAGPSHGHRTALYNTDFEQLEVTLSSGARLTATATRSGPAKVLLLEVFNGDKKLAIWDYRPQRGDSRSVEADTVFYLEIDESGNQVVRSKPALARKRLPDQVPRGEAAYLKALKATIPTLFILNADRRLDSDSVPDPSDEVELRRVMQYGEPRRINELVARSREIALSQALSAAARWISTKAVIGTNRGSMNVHSVYSDVLRRLVSSGGAKSQPPSDSVSIPELLRQLTHIDMVSAEHARYELATHLPTTDFRKALGARSTKKAELAAELLNPYVKSVEGRLEAVEQIYQLIDRFVKIINDLLADKKISFKLSEGFSIANRLGIPLSPAQLSSGEQQLLLLFCYVLTARDSPAVFMIDEPEISLNIKWQRLLVHALLDITKGAEIQFVFASHSMELLAQHRSRVVKLRARE